MRDRHGPVGRQDDEMACDFTVDRMTLRVRFRTDRVWVTDARCRPAHPGALAERMLAAHTIVFPRSGVFVRHRGATADVGDPNHVIFFNPDEPYRSSHPGGGGDDCDVVTIRADVLAACMPALEAASADRAGLFAVGAHASEPRTCLAQRILVARLERAPLANAAEAEHAILALITRVLHESHRTRVVRRVRTAPESQRNHAQWVDHAKRMLAERYREGPGLGELADAVGCSQFHLCRLFKRYTGLSIHRYLNRIRLRVALDRLTDPDRTLADLADWLGYSSHSHFTDAFRREFGVTPTIARHAMLTADFTVVHALLDDAVTPARALAPAAEPSAPTAATHTPGLHANGTHGPTLVPDDPFAFRGEELDPCPRSLPRMPLAPHAA